MRADRLRRRNSSFARPISLAAAAVASAIFARHAGAVTLTQYYYDVSIYSDAGLTKLVSSVVISQSNPVVNLPIGDYLSFGISDVVTNNPNPAAGDTSGKPGNNQPQPANLGLASVGYEVSSSDQTAAKLAPNLAAGIRATLYTGVDYYSTAKVLVPTSIMSNNDPGDVEPSGIPGFVGTVQPISAWSNPIMQSGTASGIGQLTAFTPTDGSGTASVANSTPLFDALSYEGLQNGIVDLTPNNSLVQYWVNTSVGTGSTTSKYSTAYLGDGAGDSAVTLPNLVVKIGNGLPTGPIISVAAGGFHLGGDYDLGVTSSGGPYNQINTNDNGMASGPCTGYILIQSDLLPPTLTAEVVALQMNISGGPLETLVEDINSTNVYGFGSAIASTSLANDPFPSDYNLFLTFSDAQQPEQGYFFTIFDFSQDPNVDGAVVDNMEAAAIPEPMTPSTLTLGLLGALLLRRRVPATAISPSA